MNANSRKKDNSLPDTTEQDATARDIPVPDTTAQDVPVRYYSDEVNEEFSGITRETIPIGDDFDYAHSNPLWRAASAVLYHVIMRPFAAVYCRIRFGLRIVYAARPGKHAGGCFICANHTLMAGDAFIPNTVTFPKRNYTIVHPDNISQPGLKNFVLMCGAIPIPDGLAGLRNMTAAVASHIAAGHSVTVYPEAHIWPYYTKIRPFPVTSFTMAVKSAAPVFTSTVTYSAPRHGKTPRVTVYVDGPFLPDAELRPRAAAVKLRDEVHAAMCRRAALSSYEAIRYVRAAEQGDGQSSAPETHR